MTLRGGCLSLCACALAALVALATGAPAFADDGAAGHDRLVFLQPLGSLDFDVNTVADEVPQPSAIDELPSAEAPGAATLIGPPDFDFRRHDAGDDGPYEYEEFEEYASENFFWQVGPSGLIYRSYWAGPVEPRIGITPFYSNNHTYWDATVGGRGGVLRYGDCDPLHPQGWQLDAYGAAIVRLDPENRQDLMGSDYVFGFPITYGVDNWQFKTGYAHLSSHLGDEYAIRYPGTLDERINYVRDGLVFGASWYPVWAWRLYGELDWAMINTSGGAKPIAFQFGTELSQPGPTGTHGSPFLALNGRSREEIGYGGDVTAQTGWMWRGDTGKTFRIGGHYYNGKSSQAQFYRTSEQQMGLGLWYDF